jgi:hypothetical protein
MSVIAVSAALVVEIYGFSVQAYGLIFACAGLSILVGSIVNRLLVPRIEIVPLIGAGVLLMAIASLHGPDRACQRDGAGSRPAAAHCGRRIIHYRYDPERHGRLGRDIGRDDLQRHTA